MFRRVANLERVEDVKGPDRSAPVAYLWVEIDQTCCVDCFPDKAANVQVIADGRNSNTANTAVNCVGTVVDAFNTKWRVGHGGGGPPVKIFTCAWYSILRISWIAGVSSRV